MKKGRSGNNIFTQREMEVLTNLAKGKSNNEIAENLTITSHTVKAHIASIYEKLNVSNRVQATVKYLKLIDKEDEGIGD